jgi:Tol biopolymer transport system component
VPAIVLTVLGVLGLPAGANATFPGDNGLIAFQNDTLGGIYTIKADGSARKEISDGFEPSWSANGKRIVFVMEKGADTEVFTMSASGKHRHRLTDDKKWEWEPVLSPNGKQVAFRTGEFRGDTGPIYVMDIDGSHRRRIVEIGKNPDWSRAFGKAKHGLIAFTLYDAPDPCFGTFEIATVKPTGKGQKLLPFGCRTSLFPSWRPDAKQLAFASYPPVGNSDIYIGPTDGNEDDETKLTDLGPQDEGAAWSPDQTQIAFGDTGNGLYLVSPSAPLTETQIPNTADIDGAQPAWQPK